MNHQALISTRQTLNQRVEKNRCKFFIALFLVGIFNNNGYTLVQAAASDLADAFGEGDFMGLFLFFMIVFGASSRLVNGACCVNIKHTTRVGIVTIFTSTSFLMIAISCMNQDKQIFFVVAIFASIF